MARGKEGNLGGTERGTELLDQVWSGVTSRPSGKVGGRGRGAARGEGDLQVLAWAHTR